MMTYFTSCVAEDDRLCYGECVVKVAQRVEFPILLFDGDEKLLDAFKRQFITLDENANRVGHEFCCHLQNIVWQGGAEQDDLGSGREVTVDVINLILEALVEELVGLVQDEHLDVARAEDAPPNHVEDPAGRPREDVLTIFEFTYVLADGSAADARVTLHVHVVAQGEDDGLDLRREFAGGGEDERLGLSDGDIDGLQHGDGEGGRFTRAGLGLRDDIPTLCYREDRTLLNRGGLFKICTVPRVRERDRKERGTEYAL
jgi:hypothetical protein